MKSMCQEEQVPLCICKTPMAPTQVKRKDVIQAVISI